MFKVTKMDTIKFNHLLSCLITFSVIIEQASGQNCMINSVLCTFDLSDPVDPPVFHDLTKAEIKSVQNYLYSQPHLRLIHPKHANISTSFIFGMEVFLPPKREVLQYMNSIIPIDKPPRAALVTIFRGDIFPPAVEEHIVFPLPWPTQHRLHRSIPYHLRPYSTIEFLKISDFLARSADRVLRQIMLEMFDGRTIGCGNKCLGFFFVSAMGPTVTKIPGARKTWYWMHQIVEFSMLNPVDFAILLNENDGMYAIEKVYFNNMYFSSLNEFAIHYQNPTFPKIRVPFPTDNDFVFSRPQRRGHLFPDVPVSPPRQVEPEGKRYCVRHQEVKYMNWKFNFRLSPSQGPRIYNVRYIDKLIVYELALQDIAVFYSGAEPQHKYANFFDSSFLIGANLEGMVPGVDCPTGATFIDTHVVVGNSIKPLKLRNAFCVFEQNTGDPLRRHMSTKYGYGVFFEGAPSNVLILRTIVTISNYDYTVDFIFHQNGVLQTKVVPTGFILPSMFTKNNWSKYGFRLNNKLVGNLHHHAFNFKVDIDINGQHNRYETMDIVLDETNHPSSSDPFDVWYQSRIRRSVKKTEAESLLKFNFDQPKYHIFYNNNMKSPEGNDMAYRLVNKGMSKSILPEGIGNEGTGAWMRYQLAVTRRKETEPTSSSVYSAFGSYNPVVNFKTFYSDNENILDKDLVAWVTMGTHHIPHTEDLPMTHTPGLDLSFFLSPFNYFPEDPGMGSRDSVRIEPVDKRNLRRGIKVDKQTFPEKMQCKAPIGNYYEHILKRPDLIFEM
ncbi:hypothetical protein FSP39_010979 [Pinctada imbricata]|uniref:Amine oxidase n=1 Tax=Pinctada imbricata TaxID=66713 RepID=A0AA88Y8N2_PINIB|nr:hypothetical protein FSP39_010979 [Pinctada imbricata]